jgi:hypothetical protein
MAASMTFAYDDGHGDTDRRRGIRKVICSWTSAADGTTSGTTGKLVGTLIKATTNPDGTAAPDDNYDVVLSDADGVDVLAICQSSLLNRDTANSEERYFLVLDAAGTPLAKPVHPVVCGVLTVSVSNAGDSKSGVLTLFLRD